MAFPTADFLPQAANEKIIVNANNIANLFVFSLAISSHPFLIISNPWV
jgi:hypothetical protein